MSDAGRVPRVRVVVVDYDGGDLTLDCLAHLVATDHPAEALDLVLVDNGSHHPVTTKVRHEYPTVRIVESPVNRGFGGGSNLGTGDLDDVDFVAFVNNDATVPPGWLQPLLEVLADEPTVGAACPKLLLARRYRELALHVPTVRAGRGDDRELGVRVDGVRVDGRDVWGDVHFPSGTYGPEPETGGRDGRWTGADARVLVPAGGNGAAPIELRLAAVRPTTVTIGAGAGAVTHRVDPEPDWVAVRANGEPFDVVNNVGTHLVADGYAADRGWLERDTGQYERAEDVFAWCGAAVVLRADYLRDVGPFDERLFLYSEDVELSWRGLQRGWRHRYVPASDESA